jgi:hypothetical protein
MSPLQAHPSGRAVLARLALRRVAVPVANPRVFQVFEQMHERALRRAAGSPQAPAADRPRS